MFFTTKDELANTFIESNALSSAVRSRFNTRRSWPENEIRKKICRTLITKFVANRLI